MTHDRKLREMVQALDPELLGMIARDAELHTVEAKTDGASGGVLVKIGFTLDERIQFVIEATVTDDGEIAFQMKGD